MPSSSFVRCTRTVSVRKILYTVHSVPWVLVRLFRIRTKSRRSTKNTLLTGLKNISVSSTNWTLIKAFYSLNTASCTCTKNVTLNIQCTCTCPCTLKNCLLLQKNNNKKWRLALPCALRSHDYHVTGSANQNAEMQIKYKKKGKNKTNRIK